MQKKILAAAVAVLCGVTGTAMAQQAGGSKVELWGIVDAAVRHTNNQGANQGSKTEMVGGGMSQSRWGIKVTEDLGGGSAAVAELENRVNADDGSVSSPFFQLAYVGLQGPYGRLTMGRQWNVLFDVVTSTYASFPYSPYMDAYKPELGMAVGARNSNMLKYTIATPTRNWVASLQYSFDEKNNTTNIENTALTSGAGAAAALIPGFVGSTLTGGAMKTMGGYLRYSQNGISLGGGYLRTELPGGSDVDAWTVGGSYRSGPLYLNLGYGLNKIKRNTASTTDPIAAARATIANAVDTAILSQLWSGQTNGGFQPGGADKRQMIKVGFGYQVTPQVNAGLHYFHAKQSGDAQGAYNGKANFMVAAVDYAFSKRTDAYFAVDHTKVSGGAGMAIDSASGARSRTGITAGIRHRF